jgi:Ca2+-binding EF-hand superfamily protein
MSHAKSISVLLALMVCSAAVFAQQQNNVSPEQMQKLQKAMRDRFAAADKNGNGKLTRDEAKGKMPRVYENFATIDRDKKGYVTLKEIEDSLKENVVVSNGAK